MAIYFQRAAEAVIAVITAVSNGLMRVGRKAHRRRVMPNGTSAR